VPRLLVVHCPSLTREGEHGREGRALARVAAAVAHFSPAVEVVRPGICAVATRGPSRYFGGDAALARRVADAVAAVPGPAGDPLIAGVGVADGLFAATLAATAAASTGAAPVVVPPGETPAFLAPWPVAVLERPELADVLVRLGIRTLGHFAALPAPHVLARFGTDGAACHRVARGIAGEPPGFRRPSMACPASTVPASCQPGFWGGAAAAAARAGQAVARVQQLLGPEAVVVGRLHGGRSPAERARLVPWAGSGSRAGGAGDHRWGGDRRAQPPGAPWPGQVPPPAPIVVLAPVRRAELADGTGRRVAVTGRGLPSAPPARLSVDDGPWQPVVAWAGPWPADERWWSGRSRRRRARIQLVTAAGTAYLLVLEHGTWWLEGVYA